MGNNRHYFMKLIRWVLTVLILMCAESGLYAKDHVNTQKKSKAEINQPIQIDSDRLDAYNEKKLVVFSGNAVATQSDRVIKSDQLLLYYRSDPEKTGKKNPGKNSEMGELEKIEAKGHVTVTQGERVVTGDNAVYFQDTQKIVMTGNAVMREGRNVVKGDRIIVFLDEDRGVVESNEKKRVQAIIYPEEKKDEKKNVSH
jgi:lipopolysaccharide export system protein LptA